MGAYNSLFEKTAEKGIGLGLIGGSIAGIAGGGAIGKGVANIVHPATPEVKELKALKKQLANEERELEKKYAPPDDRDIWDAVTSDSRYGNGQMTIGEFEAKANAAYNQYYKNMATEKTAALKPGWWKPMAIASGATGIPLGVLSGVFTYKSQKKNNEDPTIHRAVVDDLRKSVEGYKAIGASGKPPKKMKDVITGHNEEHHTVLFNPNMFGYGCEDISGYGRVLDTYLRVHNIDRRTVPAKDYMYLASRINRAGDDRPFDFENNPRDELLRQKALDATETKETVYDDAERQRSEDYLWALFGEEPGVEDILKGRIKNRRAFGSWSRQRPNFKKASAFEALFEKTASMELSFEKNASKKKCNV